MSATLWPRTLWVVRHGQSSGNVARDRAHAAGEPRIDLGERDVDVPLSALGERQSRALGEWFGKMPLDARPTALLTSPYRRARQTAEIVAEVGELSDVPCVVDERLREKEFGVLDGLTTLGIQQRFPEQAALRQLLGKFYHRPPGGESWCDVLLRLRSLIDVLTREYSGERVLLVGHQVVVSCMRYLLEQLSEDEILAIDRAEEVFNCSVTAYELGTDTAGRARPRRMLSNYVSPIAQAGETVTSKPDIPAPK